MEPLCHGCSAFIHSPESLTTGKCHGCRSGPPEQRLEVPTVVWGPSPMAEMYQLWWMLGKIKKYYVETTRGNAD